MSQEKKSNEPPTLPAIKHDEVAFRSAFLYSSFGSLVELITFELLACLAGNYRWA